MSQFTFKEFMHNLSNLSMEGGHQSKQAGAVDRAIRKYVQQDEVVNFYPKNLYLEDQQLVVHIFRGNEMLIFSSNFPGTDLFVKVLKISNITEVDLVLPAHNENFAVLIIRFSTGDKFEFMSTGDTNKQWAGTFAKLLDELFMQLSKNPQ